MKIAWATDVHLNFVDERGVAAFARVVAETGAEALLLGGDIAEAPTLEPILRQLVRKLARPIYFVLGNHDYYRGSIADVREIAARLTREVEELVWLPAAGHVELGDTVLVGHGGWGDGRLGDYWNSRVQLTDHVLISELAGLDRARLLERLHALGDEAATRVREVLEGALAARRRALLLTHVPPFEAACWHEGAISDPKWLPHFTCKAVGDVLEETMIARPDHELLVLCGHTHGAGDARILPNLHVKTAGATYGRPRIAGVIDLETRGP